MEAGVSAAKPSIAPRGGAERAIVHAESSEAWLRHALEEIVTQIHRLLDLTGCAFQVVDWKRRYITSAAAWFESDPVRDAFGSVLSRPYEPERAGLTEASIEAGEAAAAPPTSRAGPAPRACAPGWRSASTPRPPSSSGTGIAPRRSWRARCARPAAASAR